MAAASGRRRVGAAIATVAIVVVLGRPNRMPRRRDPNLAPRLLAAVGVAAHEAGHAIVGRLMPEHFIRENTGQSPAEFLLPFAAALAQPLNHRGDSVQ